MATLVGGVATSHTPTIGFALDANKQDDPIWAPIFKGYEPVVNGLAEKKPDVLLYIYNDHMTSFFIDHYSHFTLGVGDEFPVADEGGGPRKIPPMKGNPEFAQHVAMSMVADEFDISTFQNKGLDHGCFSPLSLLLPHEESWPTTIVPLQVGVLQVPGPTAKRCFNLGKTLRKAILSYPEDIKVAVFGTGGLSHQVHGERCGFNDTEWDMEFLDRLEKDPESLLDCTTAELAEKGGMEGAEVIMWMMMRGALSSKVNKLHQAYYLPSMCPIATVIYEDAVDEPADETQEEHLKRINHQIEGIEKLEGTYPFTIERGVKAFRLNNYLHNLIYPENRELFKSDQERSFEEAELTEEERTLVRDLNWRGMIHYGVIFFMLEKLGAVVGTSNPAIYAAMKGMELDDFLQTRNAQIQYSVAGDEEGKTDWDKK